MVHGTTRCEQKRKLDVAGFGRGLALDAVQEGPPVRVHGAVLGLAARRTRGEVVAVGLAIVGIGVESCVGIQPFPAAGHGVGAGPLDPGALA